MAADSLRRTWAVPCALALLASMAACSTISAPARIALLAPFEGRYREVGYNALYAARLAFQDAGDAPVELLPIDDGGTVAAAADRARALQVDPQVAAILALGVAATNPQVLETSGDLPVVIVGAWGASPADERVFVLSNPAIDTRLTIAPRTSITEVAHLDTPITASDSFALAQLSHLRSSLEGITILSSASLPDAAFAQRYRSSDQFAPPPGLLASLTYDAAGMLVQAAESSGRERSKMSQTLAVMTYNGLNGTITFDSGFWADAPMHRYVYDAEGALRPVEDIVK